MTRLRRSVDLVVDEEIDRLPVDLVAAVRVDLGDAAKAPAHRWPAIRELPHGRLAARPKGLCT